MTESPRGPRGTVLHHAEEALEWRESVFAFPQNSHSSEQDVQLVQAEREHSMEQGFVLYD